MLESLSLLQTKLYRPPLQPDLVLRPRLIDRLNKYWQTRPLTLISAPTGSGKSVLASMWLEHCSCPSGWVSFDERDNDLIVFTAYLLAAVKKAFPNISLETEALLKSSNTVPPSMLARSFLNDLDRIETPFILVLDDLHTIHDRATFDFLTSLLNHPPRAMHLVLLSRQDPPLPIASLRVYQRITEIRMDDLRFRASETAKLLELILHEEVDKELASEWTRQSEGWATALHLIALSTSANLEMHSSVSLEEKSHSFHDYLLVEVLNSVPPDQQRWLLRTALMDRFCASLCEAVCLEEGEALTGKTFISWLQSSDLFLISLDDGNEWFRFHHLFQNYLKSRLQRQSNEKEMAYYHQRASQWFAKNDWLEEAIHHALLAGDTKTAVQLFGENRHHIMNKDRWLYLERLLNLFPEEVVASNPMLLITKAHVAAVRSRDTELLSCMERAQRLAVDLPQDLPSTIAVQGEILTVQCIAALYRGQIDEMIAYGQMATERLPSSSYYIRGIAAASLMVGYQMSGDIDRSVQIARNVLVDPTWPRLSRAIMNLYQGTVLWMNADLVGAKRTFNETLRLTKNQYLSNTAMLARYFLGAIHYLQNDLKRAEASLSTLLENPAISPPTYLAHAACILSRIYYVQNRQEEAHRTLDSIGTLFEEVSHWSLAEIIRAFQVELALDQGNVAEAQHLSSSIDSSSRPPLWFYYVPQLTPIKLLLAKQSTVHLDVALPKLEKLEGHFRALNRKTILIDVLTMQALAYEAQGSWQEAEGKLIAALRLAAPGNFIRNFIDLGQPVANILARLVERDNTEVPDLVLYIAQIQGAFKPEQSPIQTSSKQTLQITKDLLTKRELQILRLLSTDSSIQEIALELTLAVSTVRTHIGNIYVKLDVHSRYEAVQYMRRN
jgi:LuxR family maltose regulon positive regulatory protein